MLKYLLLVFTLSIPVATWAFIKPARVIAPELMGFKCVDGTLCTSEPSRHAEAAILYDEALHYVDTRIGLIKGNPRVIFCSSKACSQSFGLGRRSAITVGTFGIVIGPRAWKPYYVRHEMIHWLQNERLGILAIRSKPEWFREGMAYALSGDPRLKLAEPFQRYRARFENWYKQIGRDHLWEKARKL